MPTNILFLIPKNIFFAPPFLNIRGVRHLVCLTYVQEITITPPTARYASKPQGLPLIKEAIGEAGICSMCPKQLLNIL